MSKPSVTFAREGHVGIISFNRPEKLNAWAWGPTNELCAIADRLRFDTDVRAVVLRGEGRAFCAGEDLKPDPVDPPDDTAAGEVAEGMHGGVEERHPGRSAADPQDLFGQIGAPAGLPRFLETGDVRREPRHDDLLGSPGMTRTAPAPVPHGMTRRPQEACVSTPDVERLKLAFAWHLCQQVVDADGTVLPEERAFLESHFPREQLVAHGLADADGRWTEAFGPTVEEAFVPFLEQEPPDYEVHQQLEGLEGFETEQQVAPLQRRPRHHRPAGPRAPT